MHSDMIQIADAPDHFWQGFFYGWCIGFPVTMAVAEWLAKFIESKFK